MTNISQALAQAVKEVETADLTDSQRERLDRALFVVQWGGKVCKSRMGGEPDSVRVISPARLAKTPMFRNFPSPKNAVDETLIDLARLGVCSGPQLQESTGGKRATLIYLWDRWVPGNGLDSAEIERALIVNFLIDIESEQAADPEPDPVVSAGVTPDQLFHLIEPPPPPPKPEVVAPYKPPTEPRVLPPWSVRALYGFRMAWQGGCLYFKKGQIVDGEQIAKKALEWGLPVVLCSQEGDSNPQYCPHCHRLFTLEAIPKSEYYPNPIYLRPLSDLMFTWRGQLLRFATDYVITSRELVTYLLTEPTLPTERVEPGVHFNICACGHAYSLQKRDL